MAKIRERHSARELNFHRFYEFDSLTSPICENCHARIGLGEWSNVPAHTLGEPVHTNWPVGKSSIRLVYICESPSDRETSHGLPSVGATGRGIYEEEFGRLEEGWLDTLDDHVYRTNIVRCQADAGLQKRVDTTLKNRRVRTAFEFCEKHLELELDRVISQCVAAGVKEIKIVIAAGTAFPVQRKRVADIIQAKNNMPSLKILISELAHPSAYSPSDYQGGDLPDS